MKTPLGPEKLIINPEAAFPVTCDPTIGEIGVVCQGIRAQIPHPLSEEEPTGNLAIILAMRSEKIDRDIDGLLQASFIDKKLCEIAKAAKQSLFEDIQDSRAKKEIGEKSANKLRKELFGAFEDFISYVKEGVTTERQNRLLGKVELEKQNIEKLDVTVQEAQNRLMIAKALKAKQITKKQAGHYEGATSDTLQHALRDCQDLNAGIAICVAAELIDKKTEDVLRSMVVEHALHLLRHLYDEETLKYGEEILDTFNQELAIFRKLYALAEERGISINVLLPSLNQNDLSFMKDNIGGIKYVYVQLQELVKSGLLTAAEVHHIGQNFIDQLKRGIWIAPTQFVEEIQKKQIKLLRERDDHIKLLQGYEEIPQQTIQEIRTLPLKAAIVAIKLILDNRTKERQIIAKITKVEEKS